ncbi:MAG: delta-aminolevulinic acid dehydratase [Acidimicrobiales bacterium]|nr:MAG: delta-aminolevulinic acid dehydratase [Acidimicrobiales bacterium]
MAFPAQRLRRLRRTAALRSLVAETRVSVEDLVAPLFVHEAIGEPQPIPSLPGVVQHTRESLVKEVRSLVSLGVRAFLLFGVPSRRDALGSAAWDPSGIVQVSVRELRDEFGDSIVLMTDLCLDEYTDHGHCGVLTPGGDVDNDETLELYGRIAVAQAGAGADVVAPSGMMDGQVAAIRKALDEAGFHSTAIMAYSAKYATALYGPFRDAVEVTIAGGGDRRGYQQQVPNRREAVLEALLDVEEGADIVMVKPAVSCLDVIAAVREAVTVPVAAYHVSGEYSMVLAASERGWLDASAVLAEHLTAIRRAGADIVITYHARRFAEECC